MNDQFLDLLRTVLPRTGNTPIEPETPLQALGLDSMRSIELLFAVEDEYSIELPDELLTDKSFATPASLWQAIVQVLPDKGVNDSQ